MDSTIAEPTPRLPDSKSLEFAVAAELKPQMAYTISETSLYSGVPEEWLRNAITAGELFAKTRSGNVRCARIPVEAMDKWMGMAEDVSEAEEAPDPDRG